MNQFALTREEAYTRLLKKLAAGEGQASVGELVAALMPPYFNRSTPTCLAAGLLVFGYAEAIKGPHGRTLFYKITDKGRAYLKGELKDLP